MRGTVAWFNPDKGFGFITPDGGGKDVFVHYKGIISNERPKNLSDGQMVEFIVEDGEKGPVARNVIAL